MKSIFFRKVLLLLLFWVLGGTSCAKKAEIHYVRWVIDGDTIVLENGEHVRYAGINAPEIPHDDQPGEPFGEAAKRYNIKLVKGRRVRLELAEESRDRFGRLLAYVFLPNGTFVQEALVARGLAFVCYLPPNLRFYDHLLQVERQAIEKRQGLWAEDSLFQGEPYYLGNKRSRRFHRPGCPFGRKTSPGNRIIFKRMKEAFYQGFCPCKKCRPWPGRGK